jgi:hypothetical protein
MPGIYVFAARKKDVDGRDKPGHDGRLPMSAMHLFAGLDVA